MAEIRDLSRYFRGGSVELLLPLRPRFSIHLMRNGRMLSLEVVLGDFYFSPAVYRRWSDD